jgi:hypothetical protein
MGELGRRKAQNAVVLMALMAIFILGVYVTYRGFTSEHPGANDFYPRWVGGCALLREGMNPYSEAVTLRIQEGTYGRPALPEEDQVAFAYPLYSLLFFFPLCATGNYPLVQAIWIWLLLTAFVAAVMLAMRVVHWHPRWWLALLTMLWTVVLYHSFRALVLGQFVALVFLAFVVALWAMQRGHDGWAGMFLAASTVKPQLVYLAIPWILLWAAGQRRWRMWVSFGSTVVALVLGSMILLPSWLPDFVRQVAAYPAYTVYGSLTWMLVQHWLGLSRVAELAILALLAITILTLAWRLWKGTWQQMLWMLGTLLLLTNFFTPRIATTNYILLIPWALWGYRHMQRTWRRFGTWMILFVQVTSLIALWAVFLTTVQGDFEQAPVYFPFPAAMSCILFWLYGSVKAETAS